MKVLLYADFRSPHARAWHAGLLEAGIDVVTLSSEVQTQQDSSTHSESDSIASQDLPPDFLSKVRSRIAVFLSRSESTLARLLRKLTRVQLLHSLVFLARRRALTRRLRQAILESNPDIVHTLRVPYESVTMLFSRINRPWVVSTWGADFEPQAAQDPLLRYWTRKVMSSIDAIHYDAKVDYLRAIDYGYSPTRPQLYAAGNFGVNTDLFHLESVEKKYVVYPRKIASTTNYWGFVEAVHLLLPTCDNVFVGIGLLPIQSEIYAKFPELETSRFILTDALDQETYAKYIREASVVVSPGYSDGTPNSILEAISVGASVVAGSLTHLVEMDADYSLGMFFVDAKSSTSIASGIYDALNSENSTRKELPTVMRREFNSKAVPDFYKQVLQGGSSTRNDSPKLTRKSSKDA